MKARMFPYVSRKHPEPTLHKRWVCIDQRTNTIVSQHYYRRNAKSVAKLANAIMLEYGSLVPDQEDTDERQALR